MGVGVVVVCSGGYWGGITGGKKVATKAKRWYKEVGLGFKTPAEAITGTYIGTSTTHLQDAEEVMLFFWRKGGQARL